MGPLPFSTIGPILPLPPQNPWIILVDNVGLKTCLLGIMITLTFFPWCKPKWSQDKFNNRS